VYHAENHALIFIRACATRCLFACCRPPFFRSIRPDTRPFRKKKKKKGCAAAAFRFRFRDRSTNLWQPGRLYALRCQVFARDAEARRCASASAAHAYAAPRRAAHFFFFLRASVTHCFRYAFARLLPLRAARPAERCWRRCAAALNSNYPRPIRRFSLPPTVRFHHWPSARPRRATRARAHTPAPLCRSARCAIRCHHVPPIATLSPLFSAIARLPDAIRQLKLLIRRHSAASVTGFR